MQIDILYLGSQSSARRRLLELAQINHQILSHSSDEELVDKSLSFSAHVLAIAKHKMQTLLLPEPSQVDSEYLYVLTADTLVRDTATGRIFGKPKDKADAMRMLAAKCQAPAEVLTGCCLEKFQRQDNRWLPSDQAHWTTGATIEFHVDNDSLEQYFAAFPWVLECSGGAMVEDHGLAYLKSIQGSYTAVIGLPLYELRMELKRMGFRFCMGKNP